MGTSLKAVLFDFDGTLTRPGILDFSAIRQAMQCPADLTILEYIDTLPAGEKREQSMRILEIFETRAAECAEPNIGAEDLLDFLRAMSLETGIITRNRLCSVTTALKKFNRVRASDFSVIITREDSVKPKPDPGGVLLAAMRMNVPVDRMLMVGDYVFDIEAGRRAGALTVFLDNGTAAQHTAPAHYTISRLSELKNIVTRKMRENS